MSQSPVSAAPQAVIVLGMHRSGTSALTGSLAELGYALPKDVMGPAADNPRGFFEPRSFAQLNDKILQSLGGSWDQAGPFVVRRKRLADSAERIAQHVEATFLSEACAVATRAYPKDRSIVVKEPRISLLTPLWRTAFEQLGYRPVFIHIHRAPMEVAASLQARNGIGVTKGLQIWQNYVMAVLAMTRSTPMPTVSFEQLLERPAETLGALAGRFGRVVEPEALQRAAGVLSPQDRHQTAAAGEGVMPPLVADTADLLGRWSTLSHSARVESVERLRQRFEDVTLYSGPKVAMPARGLRQTAPRPERRRPPLLLHYHLFKNAGTSVDTMLKRNFDSRWDHAEFALAPGEQFNVSAVEAYLFEKTDIDAFSSHTALLPPPTVANREVLPILFLRHPIDRLRSAYDFEKDQKAETFGARLARSTDFKGYIRALLDTAGNSQARNFQAHRLATNAKSDGDLRRRALEGLDALPFVGIVEDYDASLERLHALVSPHYPDFQAVKVRKNISKSAPASLDDKLKQVAEELGPELYAELSDANAIDLEVYATARDRHLQSIAALA